MLTILGVVVVAVVALTLLFKERAREAAIAALTADMFIAADTDSFDPGLAPGSTFPPIRAVYEGAEIDDVSEFIRDKGMIFIANRSVDW